METSTRWGESTEEALYYKGSWARPEEPAIKEEHIPKSQKDLDGKRIITTNNKGERDRGGGIGRRMAAVGRRRGGRGGRLLRGAGSLANRVKWKSAPDGGGRS